MQIQAVKGQAAFNKVFDKFSQALEANKSEWEFYFTRQDLLNAALLGNNHFFVGPDISNPVALVIFQVEKYPTGNVQINVLWSGGEKAEDYVGDFAKVAEMVAAVEGASRIRCMSCKSLVKQLTDLGYECTQLEMVRTV